MKKLWQSIEKLIGIYRWHPKIALRYLPIVESITSIGGDPSILEVGSNGLGIAPYLDTSVVGLDIAFSPPFAANLTLVAGSALQIPFVDASFDFVISADMLEHISPDKRAKAIFELVRVSAQKVYITVPCGKESETQDQTLSKIYEEKKSKGFTYLEEHLKYGLPTVESVTDMLNSAAKKLNRNIATSHMGNISLPLRFFLMNGWMSDNFLSSLFFRKLLLLFVPVLRFANQKPAYRELFTVTLES
jgi:hypothetical protein